MLTWLKAGFIYAISDNAWVNPVHMVPKKGGIIVVKNDEDELISTQTMIGWRVCIDYRKLNKATQRDHYPLPFLDHMLDRLAWNVFYCFLYGYSRKNLIAIAPEDQEKIISPILMAHLLLSECHLGYVTYQQPSKDM